LIRELKGNFMQKITGKLKNAPRDVQSLLVPCSASSSLNREETLSVKSKVRTVINPEGVQPGYTQGLKANNVYVLSVAGNPLMPCKPAKARRLLKSKRAVVVRRFPFTVQLNFECENRVHGSSGSIRQSLHCRLMPDLWKFPFGADVFC
jgi:hypothetical protein